MIEISVIIPTYNRSNLVTRAIYSCLNQELDDIEVIVVDDGSTDNTREVIKDIKDNRMKYLFQENQGVSVARNLGIASANGKYIALLDSDDFLRPWSLLYRKEFLNTNCEFNAICGSVIDIDQGNRISTKFTKSNYSIDDKRKDKAIRKLHLSNCTDREEFHRLMRDYIIKTNGGLPFVTSTFMVRKNALLENNLSFNENIKNSEDIDFFYRLSKILPIKYDFLRIFACIQFQETGLSRQIKSGILNNDQKQVLEYIKSDK